MASILLTACGGSGSTASPSVAPQSSAPTPAPQASVTVTGKMTYDRVPHNDVAGLDYANTATAPIRGAVVEAVNASGAIVASTLTDQDGDYTLRLNANNNIRLQVKAQLLSDRRQTWDVQVTDNTQNNNIYALVGLLASTGNNAEQIRDLHAPHGWTGQSYDETRSAAPFAILDSIYSAVTQFAEIDQNIQFPPLQVHWSVNNSTVIGDRTLGQIGNSAYFPDGDSGAIYILGEENRDTDEYDPHVIIHEWGHYFEHQMSRTDSIGGFHSLNDRLDARVAFSEGWSNALSAIITGDPIYKDSSGPLQATGFAYNVEAENVTNPGWFNEASVGAIIYNIFDDQSNEFDEISAGLKPIYNVMRSDNYKRSLVFATIFSLADGLRADQTINNFDIDRLLNAHDISGNGPNGNGESNNGAIRTALPVYKEIKADGVPVQTCSIDDAGIFNRLGNRDFIFLNIESEVDVKISITKINGRDRRDPDLNIWKSGELIHTVNTATANEEIFQGRLIAGSYIVETFDHNNILGLTSRRGDSCYDLTVEEL